MYEGPVEIQEDVRTLGFYCSARSGSFPYYSISSFGVTAQKAEHQLRSQYYDVQRSIAWRELGKGTFPPK